jgi:hypothetical protein
LNTYLNDRLLEIASQANSLHQAWRWQKISIAATIGILTSPAASKVHHAMCVLVCFLALVGFKAIIRNSGQRELQYAH